MICITSAELAEENGYFYFCTSFYPLAHKCVPCQPKQHWHASIWQRLRVYVCVCIRTPLLPRYRMARKHTSHVFPKWSLCFLTAQRRRERVRRRMKRARRGVSQANTKGYCTHSPLNIKDSGNCSTLLSGSSGTVGHLIHLTLGMRENGFSGDGEPFGTNVATLYCG